MTSWRTEVDGGEKRQVYAKRQPAQQIFPVCLSPDHFFLLLLDIFALSAVSSQCFSVWRVPPSLLTLSSWAQRITPRSVHGQPIASSLEILAESQSLLVMPEPCKLKSCISTTDCMYRFGKQRYGMFWGILGKMDWMTWERTDRQACTIAFLYVVGTWMEKWALELTSGLSGAGDAKWYMSFSYQFKSVYLDTL